MIVSYSLTRLKGMPSKTRIAGAIYVGDYFSSFERGTHWSAVVDITNELPRLSDCPRYLNIPSWDGTPPTADQIQAAVQFIKESRGQTLVHCAHGKGRSVTVVVAFLIASKIAKSIDEGIKLVCLKNLSFYFRLGQVSSSSNKCKCVNASCVARVAEDICVVNIYRFKLSFFYQNYPLEMLNRFFGHAILLLPAAAWDKDGHDAVGGTAMSFLDSAASSKLKGILGGEDASDVAGWAHRIEKSLGWTAYTHFMQQESDWSCSPANVKSKGVCEHGRCLDTSIRHFFRQLSRAEATNGLNVMKDEADFTDADAMRFLINLVGDASQALHAGFKSNEFGKKYFVRLPQGIPAGAGETVSLFELWDSKISQNMINNPYNPSFWWSGWTHVRNLPQSIVEAEKKLWADKGIDAIGEWLSDSAKFACQKIYTDPTSGQRITFSTDPKNPTEISHMTYRLWEQAVRERILIGGLRLGILLSAILLNPDAPSAANLRRGSAIIDDSAKSEILSNVFDELDERGHPKAGAKNHRKAILGVSAGLFNVGLLLIVALAVFFVAKCKSGIDPASISVAKSNIVEMVGSQSKRLHNTHKD
jgi:hypothetical protein